MERTARKAPPGCSNNRTAGDTIKKGMGTMEHTVKKIQPKDVAEALGIGVQAARIGLQNGIFPFGWAIRRNERYVYAISPKLFAEYVGTVQKEGKK